MIRKERMLFPYSSPGLVPPVPACEIIFRGFAILRNKLQQKYHSLHQLLFHSSRSKVEGENVFCFCFQPFKHVEITLGMKYTNA